MAKKWTRRMWTAMRIHEHNQKRRAAIAPVPPVGHFSLFVSPSLGTKVILRGKATDGSYFTLVGRQ
jgi:hypothetical protein